MGWTRKFSITKLMQFTTNKCHWQITIEAHVKHCRDSIVTQKLWCSHCMFKDSVSLISKVKLHAQSWSWIGGTWGKSTRIDIPSPIQLNSSSKFLSLTSSCTTYILCKRETSKFRHNVNLKFSKHLKLSFSSMLIIHGQFDCQMKLSLKNYEVLHT